MTQVVSITFYRFGPVAARLWAFAMMGLARPAMARVPDIGFWKLCGSGTGEGFTPRPNTAVYAIISTWPDLATARARLDQAAVFRRYRVRAAESWTVFLSPQSVRGAWSGVAPFAVSDTQDTSGPLAALTRATVKPGLMRRFWSRVPDISRVIGRDPNVMFKIGIGEVPWLHQVTFSIWPDAARMAAFARSGPHGDAIRAVRDEGWFQEELYARFALLDDTGTWGGASPLRKDTA
ncbi:spheroidene monooxygenase [Jannaschia pohangensis]|uniref:Spheroidene monooxygenase n=1 Tax=Jannaschia pohangensis TaxID=390807 RepID=A0A1I3UP35_9RHOB|nr:spheroidene monooxygenase [Jannaschia pohangensis]SFJ84685.1 spheroidene monooxygenase [Jannaschia pohangensis]